MQQLGCESHSILCVSCYVHVYGNKVIIVIIIIITCPVEDLQAYVLFYVNELSSPMDVKHADVQLHLRKFLL